MRRRSKTYPCMIDAIYGNTEEFDGHGIITRNSDGTVTVSLEEGRPMLSRMRVLSAIATEGLPGDKDNE